jgi:hypothetical protein
MDKEELDNLVKVIPINPDSTNLLFMNKYSITLDDAHNLAGRLGKIHGADFGAIVVVNGPPEEAVKLISVKDLGTE